MMVQMYLSEIWNFIFYMKGKVVILGLLVIAGFYSGGLLSFKITQASLGLGWGEIWS